MISKHCESHISESFGAPLFPSLLALIILAFALSFANIANAQNSDGVSVNLGVLDDLDPRTTMPRLLMPSSMPTKGRVVLTPPSGVDRITPQRSRVVLRPPPGAPVRRAPAATIAVPPPAPVAVAPPISVTDAPPAPKSPPVVARTSPKSELEGPATSAPIQPMQTGPMVAAEVEKANEPKADTTDQTGSEAEQTAALPSSKNEAGPVSLAFGAEDTDLPSSASSTLSSVTEQMLSNSELRVQLLAYASSADGSPSSVRRKSLSRALSVREYLMDQGIPSTRIEVRALGDQNEGGNPDRVDAIIEQR